MPEPAVRLWVGTRKGLFRAENGGGGSGWRLDGPFHPGYEIHHALASPNQPSTAYAAANHHVWGCHIYRTDDAGHTWGLVGGRVSFPPGSEREVRAIWHLAGMGSGGRAFLAGVDPAALFRTEDGGESWEWVSSLERHPTRPSWQPTRGGLTLHSIQTDPRDEERLYVSISAGGSYRSDDGGASWVPINRGVRAGYLPDPSGPAGHNPHALRLHPTLPDRLYRQDHTGVYRSDDRGEHWSEITAGLPSDFGYALAVDPGDADRCWVVPEESSHMRCVCEGKLRVYETGDGGSTWVPRTQGLPQANAYVSVLRDALCTDGLDPCGVYVGTSTGQLFASPDGTHWSLVAGYLPPILCVSAGPR